MKNDLGVEVPVGTDAFDPQGDMTELGASLKGRIVVPVANKTERAAQATALAPSVDSPLIVFRADAGPGAEVEYTTNGTDWFTVSAGNWGGTLAQPAWSTGWAPLAASIAPPVRVVFDGALVRMASGLVARVANSPTTVAANATWTVGTIPTAYAPTDTVYLTAMVYSNGTNSPTVAACLVNTDGTIALQAQIQHVFTAAGGGFNSVRIPDAFWPRKTT